VDSSRLLLKPSTRSPCLFRPSDMSLAMLLLVIIDHSPSRSLRSTHVQKRSLWPRQLSLVPGNNSELRLRINSDPAVFVCDTTSPLRTTI
jgi:hypothetical protein